MGKAILDLISSVPAVVTIGLACIALLLYGDIRAELNRDAEPSGTPGNTGGRDSGWRGRAVGFALTAVFLAFVVVRFTH